ncbi:MAG: aminodeoxychorismate/anthranilate synthase component II [Ignavibacteria bacterium]|jgi:anthranilate synthase/aminodeoxychorismate synthase-like glutamine amidotransferase
MKILLIDNYDSFTYNLFQLVSRFERNVVVKRNDVITIDEISDLKPDKIMISPGPGRPEDSKVSLESIKEFGDKIPILGVCLGHQAIGIAFDSKITYAPCIMHGKTSNILHDNKKIYKDVEQEFEAGRYHSLVIDRETISGSLEITAETKDKVIMGVRHKSFPVEGIQFHPESVLTPLGEKLINNWLKL